MAGTPKRVREDYATARMRVLEQIRKKAGDSDVPLAASVIDTVAGWAAEHAAWLEYDPERGQNPVIRYFLKGEGNPLFWRIYPDKEHGARLDFLPANPPIPRAAKEAIRARLESIAGAHASDLPPKQFTLYLRSLQAPEAREAYRRLFEWALGVCVGVLTDRPVGQDTSSREKR